MSLSCTTTREASGIKCGADSEPMHRAPPSGATEESGSSIQPSKPSRAVLCLYSCDGMLNLGGLQRWKIQPSKVRVVNRSVCIQRGSTRECYSNDYMHSRSKVICHSHEVVFMKGGTTTYDLNWTLPMGCVHYSKYPLLDKSAHGLWLVSTQ